MNIVAETLDFLSGVLGFNGAEQSRISEEDFDMVNGLYGPQGQSIEMEEETVKVACSSCKGETLNGPTVAQKFNHEGIFCEDCLIHYAEHGRLPLIS